MPGSRRNTAYVALALAVLASCGARSDLAEAEAFAESFYVARQRGDKPSITTILQAHIERDQSEEHLARSVDKLVEDAPESFELVRWELKIGDEGAGRGTYVTLKYRIPRADPESPASTSSGETLVVFFSAGKEPVLLSRGSWSRFRLGS